MLEKCMDLKNRLFGGSWPIRFIIAGLLTTLLYIVVATLLVDLFIFSLTNASSLSYIVATIFSYIIHTYWSFSSVAMKKNAAKFFTISALNFIIARYLPSLGVLLNLTGQLTLLITALVMPAITFFLHTFWTYKEKRL